MAFFDTAIPYLRILIGDLGGTPTYSDCRLEELLLVAAKLVKQDIYFPTTYTISIPAQTISPDPEEDDAFLNFTILRASCLVDTTTFRTKAALNGISANIGLASLTVNGHLEGFKYLLENGPCKTYEEMKRQYMFGQNLIYTVQAILSPFTSSTYSPQDSLNHNNQSHRDF